MPSGSLHCTCGINLAYRLVATVWELRTLIWNFQSAHFLHSTPFLALLALIISSSPAASPLLAATRSSALPSPFFLPITSSPNCPTNSFTVPSFPGFSITP